MRIPAPMSLLRLVSGWSGGKIRFRLPRANRPRIALSFDDGPQPGSTTAILDALADAGACATFFVQGTAAQAHPALIRRTHAERHCIASHGMHHVSARSQSTREALDNAVQCHDVLEQLLGCSLPPIYRPPYGELTAGSLAALLKEGFQLAFWNRDSQDSFVGGAQDILRALGESPPADRDILLFHDDYPSTAEAMPGILDALAKAGFRTARLDEAALSTSRSPASR